MPSYYISPPKRKRGRPRKGEEVNKNPMQATLTLIIEDDQEETTEQSLSKPSGQSLPPTEPSVKSSGQSLPKSSGRTSRIDFEQSLSPIQFHWYTVAKLNYFFLNTHGTDFKEKKLSQRDINGLLWVLSKYPN